MNAQVPSRHRRARFAVAWAGIASFLLALVFSGSVHAALVESETGARAPSSARCTIVGTPRADLLTGTRRADVICGRGGNDVLRGRGGNDVLRGGGGKDSLQGGRGADRLDGGAGRDVLDGGRGGDALDGGAGRDRLLGGPGRDLADYARRSAAISVSIGDGADDGSAGERDDVRADVERVRGGSGADRLTGSATANELEGGAGDDTLLGGLGDDSLLGGAGADTLDARDGKPFRDSLGCGPDVDRARADSDDVVGADCEGAAPSDLTLTGSSVAENEPAGTAVGTLATVDPDARDTHSYSLVSGPGDDGNASFRIVGSSLATSAVLDHEANARYSVRIRTTDSGSPALSFERAFTISVGNVNEAPSGLSLAGGSVAENEPAGTPAGTLTAADPDAGDTHAFALVSGPGDTDNGSFQLVGAGLRTSAAFDHEVKSVYSLRVRATDAAGASTEQALTVSVTNANDAPSALSLSKLTVAENEPAGALVGVLAAADEDTGQAHSFALVPGAGDTDNASFEIVGTSLKTTETFDFEAKSAYSVRIRVTDDGQPARSLEAVFALGIEDVVEKVNVPPSNLSLAGATVAENEPAATKLGTLAADDPDGDALTYALVSGTGDTDNGLFQISGDELRTAGPLNYEAKASLSVRVEANDGFGGTVAKAFAVTVTNVNDPPSSISLSSASVAENEPAGTTVGTLAAADEDAGAMHTFALAGGDTAAFEIVGAELRTAGPLDFEGKGAYTVSVLASDGQASFEEELTVTVTNVNEAPAGVALSDASVPENEPAGTVVGILGASDPDAGDTHAYALVAGAGDADNGSFQIVGDELRTGAVFDREAKASYAVRVRATDAAGLAGETQLTITVANVNEAPTDLSLSNASVGENAAGAEVGALSASDPDAGETHTYALVAGAGDTDNASFAIDGGSLKTAASLDFEAGGSRSVRVRATDGGGQSFEKEFTISVTDANDAPSEMSLSGSSVAENEPSGTTVGTLSSTDQDAGDTHSYSLVSGAGDADNASFAIDGSALKTAAVLDFEADDSLAIRVRTSDGNGGTFEKQFTITVTDANDPPVVTATAASLAYTENDPATALDPGLTVSDDSTTLAGAAVVIEAPNYANGQDVLAFTDQSGITGTFNAATGTLTLSGPASPVDYQAALRSVTYENTSEAPSTATRTVSFLVNDGARADSDTRGLTVVSVNDAPTLAGMESAALAYVESKDPTPPAEEKLAATLTVSDLDHSSVASATVEVTGNHVPFQDVLTYVQPAGNPVTGSFNPAIGKLTLTGPATLAQMQAALRVVGYKNTSDTPGTATRTVTFKVSDGTDASAAATRDVTVTATNDPPVADNETFSGNDGAIGNTVLTVNAPGDAGFAPAHPKKAISGDILAGDSDPEGGSVSVVAVANQATNDGGKVTIEADGDFAYAPAAATSCTDTSDFFDYTITDSDPAGAETATGRVTIAIAGCVWYVSNNAAGNSGTSEAPFDTLAQAETASGDNAPSGAGHTVFVFDGDNTSTGYGGDGYQMNAGERLIGEHEGLTVDPDGGGGLTADVLHPANAGAHPTLTATNADVVSLDDGNVVRGFNIDPAGTGGGIAGGNGDTGGGTIDDVNIVDNGTVGTQPGLELDSTLGTFAISNLVVDNEATGVRLHNSAAPANAVEAVFDPASQISLASTNAPALDVDGTVAVPVALGTSTFDDILSTGSGAGGVSVKNATGTTSFGDGVGTDLSIATSSSSIAAFELANAGGVTVDAAGDDNVVGSAGPAVDVTGTPGATLAFDDVDSTGSASDGINLAGLGAGSFTAASGTIAGASGIGFDLDGGSGAVTYPGNLNNGTGATAEITGRTGGAITLSGSVNDTNDAGGGITVSGNTGGSTTFSNGTKTLNTGASDALIFNGSDGHTLTLSGGGLDIDTTSGKGLEATTSGTLEVSGIANTIDTGSGRGLNVSDTDIAAADLTFQHISTNGAPTGIRLNNTGTAGNLAVTGVGGTCTNADTSGCTGGVIRNGTGADSSSATPDGSGIVLNNTDNVSLTRMHIHDHSNYGIRGTDVNGFTLANSVINGTNGNNSSGIFSDSSVYFDNDSGPALTGSASITNTHVSGGFTNNVWVSQHSGNLNRLTMDNINVGPNGTASGNAGLMIEGLGTSTTNVTLQNSTLTSSRAMVSHFIGNGSGGGDLDVYNNDFSNNHPQEDSASGLLGINGGAAGTFSIDVSNGGTAGNHNTFQSASGTAVNIVKTNGSGTLTGTFSGNTIGVDDPSDNSGSLNGSGLQFIHAGGGGTATLNITNNTIREYNNDGITLRASAGGVPDNGTFNANVTGNTVTDPGSNPAAIGFNGIRMTAGVLAGDAFTTCVNIKSNSVVGSNTDPVDNPGQPDIFAWVRMNSTMRLPGYGGGATDGTAVGNFLRNQNDANPNSAALEAPAPTAGGLASNSGVFSGTGTACP